MSEAVRNALVAGITMMAFGDLFLEDVRRYREAHLAGTGMAPLFPIWGLPTDDLAREMVEVGLRARVTCVDPRQLPTSFAGRDFDAAFLSAEERLPAPWAIDLHDGPTTRKSCSGVDLHCFRRG